MSALFSNGEMVGGSVENTDFTSSDVADGQATSWTTVTPIVDDEPNVSLFTKLSQIAKNVRFLKNKVFDDSTLSSGYKVFPDGTKIVWGVTSNVLIQAGAQATLIEEITLPVTMTSYRVACINNMGVPVIPFIYNKTSNGFKIYAGNPFSDPYNATIEYIIIGY